MLIFNTHDEYHVFIHIPKNSGKYIRKKITNNKDNIILHNYWHIKSKLDLAHIPYMMKDKFIISKKNNFIKYNFFAHTRNPYDRIISGFFYKNPHKNIADFKYFVKKKLVSYNFDLSFDYSIIHYYPQYLFVCDKNLDIPKNIKINKLEDVETPKKYDLTTYFDDKCYDIINNIYCKDFLFFSYQKKLANDKHYTCGENTNE